MSSKEITTTEQAISRRQGTGFSDRGIQLRNMEDAIAFADTIAKSGLAPKGMERAASILVAIQMGAEIGLHPLTALRSIAVINGRPSVWGDAMLGICQASPAFDHAAFNEEVKVSDNGFIEATCTVRRLPEGHPIVRTFTSEDASQADLLGKKGPWQQYPRRMCQLRARGFALRDGFADLLQGFEVREIEEASATTVVEQVEAPKSVDDLVPDQAE